MDIDTLIRNPQSTEEFLLALSANKSKILHSVDSLAKFNRTSEYGKFSNLLFEYVNSKFILMNLNEIKNDLKHLRVDNEVPLLFQLIISWWHLKYNSLHRIELPNIMGDEEVAILVTLFNETRFAEFVFRLSETCVAIPITSWQ